MYRKGPYTSDQLCNLATRAASLRERIEGPAGSVNREIDGCEEFVSRWLNALGGDKEHLARRLAVELPTPTDSHSELVLGGFDGKQPSPEWARRLNAILAHCRVFDWTMPLSTRDRSLIAGQPLPFEELCLPFVCYGREQLAACFADSSRYCSAEASMTLERQLLTTLTNLAQHTFGMRFQHYRAARNPLSMWRRPLETSVISPNRMYRNFINAMLQGQLSALFLEFPVLGRLMVRALGQWVEATADFLRRLDSDRGAIADIFNQGLDPGLIQTIQPALSDPRDGGRRVMSLTFECGLRLVYKARDLGGEAAFYDLVTSLKGAIEADVLIPTILNRNTHGWMQFIEYRPCRNLNEAKRYYYRVGAVLCLLYLVKGSDCYYKNVVACGEYPILVDLEILVRPRRRIPTANGVSSKDSGDSVLSSGLLPSIRRGKKTRANNSALGQFETRPSGLRIHKWADANTDQMRMEKDYLPIDKSGSYPTVNGNAIPACDYVSQIVEGFTAVYRAILKERQNLKNANSPLGQLLSQQVRVAMRRSNVYRHLNTRLLHPEFLRSGIDRSLQIETLAKIAARTNRESDWGIFMREHDAIERMDIPIFHTQGDSRDLLCRGQVVQRKYFQQSGADRVLSNLQQMDERDLNQQVRLIRESIGDEKR